MVLNQLGLTLPTPGNKKAYAIRFKELSSQRIDPFFYTPNFVKLEEELRALSHEIAPLGSQLSVPPMNGIDARDYLESGQRYLRVQNVRPFEIDRSDARFVLSEHSKDVSLKTGDVLLTRKGTFGVAAPVTEENEGDLISSEIILLRLSEKSKYTSNYLVGWLNSSFAQALLNRRKTGGIMGHITQDVVNDFPVPVPNKKIQEKIANEITRVREEARRLRSEAETEWQAAKERFEAALLSGENK